MHEEFNATSRIFYELFHNNKSIINLHEGTHSGDFAQSVALRNPGHCVIKQHDCFFLDTYMSHILTILFVALCNSILWWFVL